ncbi:MAG: hypothetical protein NUV67_04715 [archaeon]|nr:hypothetical protein [archaeon]
MVRRENRSRGAARIRRNPARKSVSARELNGAQKAKLFLKSVFGDHIQVKVGKELVPLEFRLGLKPEPLIKFYYRVHLRLNRAFGARGELRITESNYGKVKADTEKIVAEEVEKLSQSNKK